MRVGLITIDLALKDLFNLLEADTVRAIKLLPKLVRERFCKFLSSGFVYRGLQVSPSTNYTAVGAGNGAVVGRFIWNREFIAAALLAADNDVALPVISVGSGIEVLSHCAIG